MYKAIRTRYLGPTNFKGSRVAVDDGDGNRAFYSWQPELNSEDNHKRAAEIFADKMRWLDDKRKLVGGWHGNSGVFVFTEIDR